MLQTSRSSSQHEILALAGRRAFLRRALLTAAYVAPVVVSYPQTLFAAHCNNMTCGGMNHMAMMMTWSPGCSLL